MKFSLLKFTRRNQLMLIIVLLCIFSFVGFLVYYFLHQGNMVIKENVTIQNIPVSHTKPHPINYIVPASLVTKPLQKPLVILEGGEVSCPERGGKNTQCGKVSAEYSFFIPNKGVYYLYIQVRSPSLNDNSLWIGTLELPTFYSNNACSSTLVPGILVPHKHVSGSTLLCCPKYLSKNAKKGLIGFYSDCCFNGLGNAGNEKGCVVDLEISTIPLWIQVQRVFKIENDNKEVKVLIYAREDGTSWLNLVMSTTNNLGEKELNRLKRVTEI